ncbi:hypothetical protein U0070_011678, partial [Myodes glareolus]
LENIKARIQDNEGILPNQQLLTFAGKLLKMAHLNESTLHGLRLCGSAEQRKKPYTTPKKNKQKKKIK